MIINKFYKKNIKNNYIDLYYNKKDEEVINLLDIFETKTKIKGKNNDLEVYINIIDILYFEVVDRRCFAYLESQVFLVDFSLQSILLSFEKKGFVRINKSMIVNAYKIDEIKPIINMKLVLKLSNNEKVIVNRSYRKYFYSYLKYLYKYGVDYEE